MGLILILLIIIVVLLIVGLGIAAVMGGLQDGVNTILNAMGVNYEVNINQTETTK